MNLRNIFRENLKFYRLKKKLSQEKLAELSELSVNYIGEIERNSRKVTIDTIEKIANGLGITAAELLTEKKKES